MLTRPLETSPTRVPPARVPDPGGAASPVDEGLRSLLGIRWLLIVGALVVAVSTVHLMASAWGGLAPAAKAAVLILGTLAIGGAGDVLRHRLRLPTAGGALLFLYCGLMPLLAWGAAVRSFLEAPFGWPVVLAGLSALVLLSRRVLREVLGYDGLFFPVSFGTLLLAVPVLASLQPGTAGAAEAFFLISAFGLGFLARSASRHVNRFFFHRDRLAGSQRPVHLLPFAMLGLVYGLAMSPLVGFSALFAVPLAFGAVMLIDTGEEYYRALTRALGRTPEVWPRRSRALLALGFAALFAAVGLAPIDASGRALALVSALAAYTLLRWGLRYRQAISYGSGLLVGLVAYETSPTLWRSFAMKVHASGSQWLNLAPDNPAWLAIGQLGAVALLTMMTVLLRKRLSSAQRCVHAVFMAAHGVAISLLALGSTSVALWLTPIVALLLGAAAFFSRRAETLPAIQLNAAIAALAAVWSWILPPGPSLERFLGRIFEASPWYAVGFVGIAFMALGWRWRHRLMARLEVSEKALGRWLILSPLVLSFPPLLLSVFWLSDGGLAGGGALVASFALTWGVAGWIARSASALRIALIAFGGTVAAWLTAVGATALIALTLTAQAMLLATWLAERGLSRWQGAAADPLRRALVTGLVFYGGLGLMTLLAAAENVATGEAWLQPLHLAFLALVLGDRARHRGAVTTSLDMALWVGWLFVPLQALGLGAPLEIALLAAGAATVLAELQWRRRRKDRNESAPADVDEHVARRLAGLDALWQGVAVVFCVLVASPGAFLLSIAVAALVFHQIRRGHSRDLGLALSVLMLPLLQAAVLTALFQAASPLGFSTRVATVWALVENVAVALPVLALGSLLWLLSLPRLQPRRKASVNGLMGPTELVLALGYVLLFMSGQGVSVLAHGVLIAAAAGRAAWYLRNCDRQNWGDRRNRDEMSCELADPERDSVGRAAVDPRLPWAAQMWLVLGLVQGTLLIAGLMPVWWTAWGGTAIAFGLVAVAVGERVTAEALERRGRKTAATPCRPIAFAAAGLGTFLSLGVTLDGAVPAAVWGTAVWGSWLTLFPAVCASLFFLYGALMGESRRLSALASTGSFAAAFFVFLMVTEGLPVELFWLPPGLALIGLSRLLRRELGERWSLYLLSLGAVCLYAMPTTALIDGLDWLWQSVLLVMAAGFGVASFRLRSRSLLVLSSVALAIDLICLAASVGRATPLLLWVGGVLFGLGLMGLAAALEHHREKLFQQWRVWRHQWATWN